jgi:PBP1b-binding outer membrane lipoprotein LpoB
MKKLFTLLGIAFLFTGCGNAVVPEEVEQE